MTHFPACAANVLIFQTLPAAALEELGRSAHHRHCERGTVVIADESPVEFLAVVARGRLKAVRTSSGGREQVVRTLGPGDFAGELALFYPARQHGDLIALEPTDVCLITRRSVQSVIEQHPEVPLKLVEVLARRLAAAEETIAGLGLQPVQQRLAAELLRAAGQAVPGEGAVSDMVTITLPVSWAELAVQLGTTPESLSRKLGSLTRMGVLRRAGTRTVVVRDLQRLRTLAEG